MTQLNDTDFDVSEISSIEDHFTFVENIGKGTYATVSKCIDKATNKPVALKAIKKVTDEDGFTKTTLREIRLLQKLNHENIVKLQKVLICKGTIYLVLEYCQYDLSALLHRKNAPHLSERFIKCIQFQLMVCLRYLDTQRVIHRDLKPANLFITENNVLKLGDFGLARDIMLNKRFTSKVITQWYRPPELLFGCSEYGIEVDIWSAACIFYEIITKKPLFYTQDTNNELAQLIRIFKICGMSEESRFMGYDLWRMIQPHLSQFPPPSNLKIYLEKTIPKNYHEIINLLLAMLRFNPKKRPTPSAILDQYFTHADINYIEYLDPYQLDKLTLPEMHGSSSKSDREKEKEAEQQKQLPSQNEEAEKHKSESQPKEDIKRPEKPELQ